MATIVILGAGPTGLSAAYHLEQAGFHDYRIFEKEDATGGLCRSVYQDGFTFDYTGHLLHINDPYFKSFLASLVEQEELVSIQRRSYVYSEEQYTHYPYQMNLHGLPIDTITECIEGYINRKNTKNPKTFLDWVMQNFGAGFAKHFFVPYQTKIFAYDITKISASWTGRFVPQTNLKQILAGALQPKESESIGYNAQFFYPNTGGIQFWVDRLAKKIKNKIHTNHAVTKIDAKNNIVHFANGAFEHYDTLISTIPLDFLLKNLEEPSSSTIQKAHTKLLCNSVINFNLGIKGNISDKHWIYFPESKYPFYRIGFPHNFSPHMAPQGHSSLYGEFAYLPQNSGDKEALTNKAISLAKKVLNFENSDIVTTKILDIKHAYVLYTFWREKNLPYLLDHLESLNIHSIGRYGAWKYSSMQEAILDGKIAVEKIVTQFHRFPIERVYYASM